MKNDIAKHLFSSAMYGVILIALFSCGRNPLAPDAVTLSLQDEEVMQLKADAARAFKSAHAELMQDLPLYDGLISTERHPQARELTMEERAALDTNALDARGKAVLAFYTAGDFSQVSNYLASTNSWGVREDLYGVAMEAYGKGNTAVLTDFIQKKGLLPKVRSLEAKYDLLRHQKNLSIKLRTKAITHANIADNLDGDIYLCYTAGLASAVIGLATGTHWSHAGVLDRSRLTLNADDPDFSAQRVFLSASDQTGNNPSGSGSGLSGSGTGSGFIAQVGYETIAKWEGETAACSYRAIGRSDAAARGAIDYGAQFVGKGYSFFTDRWDNENWYCSKVAFRAWHAMGVNLEQRYQTFYYTYWVNYTFPILWWTVTVSLPALGSYSQWIAANDDIWVTPDDLKDNPFVSFVNGDAE
ncbi:MAG: hypothetical protein AABZ39_16150 [Spirochaetota bacterium]